MIYGYRFIFLFSNSFRASSLPYAKAMPTERRSSSLLERFAEGSLPYAKVMQTECIEASLLAIFAELQLALCKDMKNILS